MVVLISLALISFGQELQRVKSKDSLGRKKGYYRGDQQIPRFTYIHELRTNRSSRPYMIKRDVSNILGASMYTLGYFLALKQVNDQSTRNSINQEQNKALTYGYMRYVGLNLLAYANYMKRRALAAYNEQTPTRNKIYIRLALGYPSFSSSWIEAITDGMDVASSPSISCELRYFHTSRNFTYARIIGLQNFSFQDEWWLGDIRAMGYSAGIGWNFYKHDRINVYLHSGLGLSQTQGGLEFIPYLLHFPIKERVINAHFALGVTSPSYGPWKFDLLASYGILTPMFEFAASRRLF